MTPTGSPPTSKPPHPKKKGRGKTLALAAVALLVGAIAVQGLQGSLWPFGGSEEESNETMELFESEGPEGLLGVDPAGSAVSTEAAIAAAQEAVAQAGAEADSSVQAKTEAAQDELRGLLSTHGGLPSLPVDYVPGGSVDQFTSGSFTAPYGVPDFSQQVPLGLPAVGDWSSLPSEIPEPGSMVPPEIDQVDADKGSGELDDLFGDVEETAGAGDLDGDLGSVLEVLGGESPVPGLPPLDGAGDAEQSLEPHEEGAQVAFQHADTFIGAADGVYSDISSEAGKVVAQHSGLVGEVESNLEAASQVAADAQGQVLADMESYTSEAIGANAAAHAGFQAQADTHIATVQETRMALEDEVRSHVQAQSSTLQDVVASQQADLESYESDIRADAQARIAALVEETERLALEMQEHGADSADIQALVEQAQQHRVAIEAQAEADVQMLLDASDGLQAQGDVLVDGLHAQAEAFAASSLESSTAALEETQERLAFAIATADAETEKDLDLIEEGAIAALAEIESRNQAHTEAVIEQATQASAETEERLVTAIELIEAIQAEANSEVNKDLDYILGVAQDYSDIPTPEREEKAEFWFGTHSAVTGDLGGMFILGDEVSGEVGSALSLVQQNMAGLQAL